MPRQGAQYRNDCYTVRDAHVRIADDSFSGIYMIRQILCARDTHHVHVLNIGPPAFPPPALQARHQEFSLRKCGLSRRRSSAGRSIQ
eukprot:4107137-Pleurochrysis_carterae.AAC.3